MNLLFSRARPPVVGEGGLRQFFRPKTQRRIVKGERPFDISVDFGLP
jgi:hypothetical protein